MFKGEIASKIPYSSQDNKPTIKFTSEMNWKKQGQGSPQMQEHTLHYSNIENISENHDIDSATDDSGFEYGEMIEENVSHPQSHNSSSTNINPIRYSKGIRGSRTNIFCKNTTHSAVISNDASKTSFKHPEKAVEYYTEK